MAQHEARLGSRASVVHVQVRPAQGARGDAQHDVGGLLNGGITHLGHADLAYAFENDSFHLFSSGL
jgi:hypothetical protein